MPNIVETIQKLHSFRKLAEGWRFGEGGPPSPALITKAEQYLRHAVKIGIETANVFSGADKEVVLGFYSKDGRAIEITYEPDGSIMFAKDFNDRQVDCVENISEVHLYQRIWQFQFPPLSNASFVPSIRETSTKKQAGLTAHLLSPQATVAASRSSTVNVRPESVAPSASTSRDITPIRPSFPASTGSYPWPLCQVDA